MNRKLLTYLLVFGVLILIPPLFFAPSATYLSRRFIVVLTFALFAMALNIVFGETDQLILFTGGIAAIGTYVTALTAEQLGVSPWATLLLGATLAGAFGALVCYVAARREFTVIVLAIVTFGFQLIIMELLVGLRDITGGSTGFPFSGLEIAFLQDALGIGEFTVAFYVLVALFAGVLGTHVWLKNSKYGLAFEAIRQDEFAARATGVNVVRIKVFAGFVSTFIIGLVGPFYAQSTGIVIPSLFTFASVDVLVLIILILGGLRTTLGPLVGAAAVIYIYNLLSDFGQWRTVVFGLLLTFLFIYFRQGFIPYLTSTDQYPARVRRRIASVMGEDSN